MLEAERVLIVGSRRVIHIGAKRQADIGALALDLEFDRQKGSVVNLEADLLHRRHQDIAVAVLTQN